MTIPILVFLQQKKIVSLSVLRMSALKCDFSVLLSMLEYPALIYKQKISIRRQKLLPKNLDIEIKPHQMKLLYVC